MACRDIFKAERAANEIKTRNSSAIISRLTLDCASLQSVRKFAEQINKNEEKIDILVLNAGIPLGPAEETKDGFEMNFGVHHLAHFLLTLHLLPIMKKSADARVISVSTIQGWGKIHFDNINLRNGAYWSVRAHAQSKLANILFARELAKRLGPNSTVKSYVMNPSGVNTKIWYNHFFGELSKKVFALPIEMGPATIMYCALEESLVNESGHYYE